FFGVFRPDAFRAAFGIPDAYVPLGAIAIGFRRPDEPSSSLARGRRPVPELVHRGRWSPPPRTGDTPTPGTGDTPS
ncbi:MAG: nitroreductase family protein, partial [Acidimicrobiales bacterium]